MKTKLLIITLFLSVAFISCKKDPVEPEDNHTHEATEGTLELEFEAMVDTNALVFNTQNYLNANGDTFNVSLFKYYISNVVLTKSDNSTYTVPNSYYLVTHNGTSNPVVSIGGVPNGTYKAITFLIGVDSARNVSGVQSGALDPVNGMFWSWSSGYIMAKMEGTSPQSGNASKALKFHVGGFSGVNNTLKTVSPSFGTSTATINGEHGSTLHIKTDLSEWFKTPNTVSFATMHTVHMPGTMAKMIADNYADMFSVEHIHNH